MIGGGVMMGREGLPEEEDIDDLAPQIDMGGDACCIDAKNKFEELTLNLYPNAYDDDRIVRFIDAYNNMDCVDFREMLERYVNEFDADPDKWKHLHERFPAIQQILDEWDECTQQSMGLQSDEAMDMYRSEEGGHKSAGDLGWLVAKGIIFDGREYDEIDEIDAILRDILSDPKNKKPALPWGKDGKRRGIPWTGMRAKRLEGGNLNEPFHALPGFSDSSEMLPTILNWEGGKTQIQPEMRAMVRSLGRDFIPAELFGGSGSFILGQNTGKGLYSDINPDLVTVMRHLQAGMVVPNLPQNQEELESAVEQLNDLRHRRDVLGEDLDFDEERRLAQLFIGANLQHRNGMFQFKDWDKAGFGSPTGYSEGFIKRPSFRQTKHPIGHPDHRFFPYDAVRDGGVLDLRPYASRLRGIDIHQGDLRETSKLLTPDHVLYLDPPYLRRNIDYGGSAQQREGKDFDELQRDTIRIGREHEGPSIISNYMYDKDTHEPLRDYIEALLNAGYDIYPWLRKPKANKLAQAELLALRGFPKQQRLDRF
tara:strand:+ start:252 stop:1862 length:1611 start_codon:yes stop_codon:yes gene_type:complete